ncbi:hypothetical protein NLI96_g733 [Meripilus lineatus]|uniref:Uncharacterized protein n=1 Tax=Meripilus lineatus TaxID=2056292 RepID=A0AAD5VG08_9APHY|nr:hypothetical protein NLI96_g733 [Physisporinus lineatus]
MHFLAPFVALSLALAASAVPVPERVEELRFSRRNPGLDKIQGATSLTFRRCGGDGPAIINSIGFTKIPAADGISNRMVDTSEDDLLTRGCTDDDGALQIGESAVAVTKFSQRDPALSFDDIV